MSGKQYYFYYYNWIIYVFHRNLRQQNRVKVHIHLLIALGLCSFVTMLWYALVHRDLFTSLDMADTVISQNPVSTQISWRHLFACTYMNDTIVLCVLSLCRYGVRSSLFWNCTWAHRPIGGCYAKESTCTGCWWMRSTPQNHWLCFAFLVGVSTQFGFIWFWFCFSFIQDVLQSALWSTLRYEVPNPILSKLKFVLFPCKKSL